VTDASGRASSGAAAAVVVVDAFVVPGVASDATTPSHRDGFIVVNPLRHGKADGGRRGGCGPADSDGLGPESTGGVSQGDRGDAGEQWHLSPKSVAAVSRLQRVVAAQQPVASTRTAIFEPSKDASD
jgi:hypothetical protein